MPSQITNYQCPSCTGPLHYAGASGKLECEYCGNSFAVAEIEALYGDQVEKAEDAFEAAQADRGEWDLSGLKEDWGTDEEKMKAYNCPSCGAQLICEETTAATACPYCGNPTIVPGQFCGTLRPDYVIPFKLSKEDAKAALKRFYKGKKLLPKTFAEENHIAEIKGIYVPFWLFDGTANANLTFKTTRSRRYRRGDVEITETDHFLVRRAGKLAFEKIPVDASSKMPDEHMDSIEPFDYGGLKDFSTAYLPGFFADKYDVDAKESAPRADARCKASAISALTATVLGYDTVIPVRQDVALERGAVKYAMLPVWMLKTKWQGKDFLFAMNGQTGKLIGDLPISWGKFWVWFAGIFVPTAVITAIVLFG